MADGHQTLANLLESLDFDPVALRERYREERDRRVRPEGKDQYQEVAGEFSHYVDDPHVTAPLQRPAQTRAVDVLVVGAGFAGLSVAAKLKSAGVDDFLIVEKGGDVGGTWYWNRYPGAMCDTDAYIYLPLLEETGFIPSQKYIDGAEILAHAQRIADHYGLREKSLFQTQVTEMRWSDADAAWTVTTSHGDNIRARFVVQTVGVLDRPKLPGIAGIADYKGHTFHTSRWYYNYTGGNLYGGLDKLGDKTVAVIGTGATAIQCIPHLAEGAKHLFVFQRTPSSVDLRGNRPTDEAWAKSLQPGWHKRRRENFVALTSGAYQDEDLVNDGWTETTRSIGGFFAKGADSDTSLEELALRMEIADFRKMNQVRARVDAIVQDRATAESLKPWYRQFCKRPTFSDQYLPTFNRENVTLVDTRGQGVERMTENGIVFDGREYAVDCIVFATGFEVGTSLARRTGSNIYGRGGVSLTDKWRGGLRTLHGFYSRDFPNLFHMGVNQNGLSYVFTYPLDEQADHIVSMLCRQDLRSLRRIEPTAKSEAEWVATIRELSAPTIAFQSQCTPGYHNNEGKADQVGGGIIDEAYGGGALDFYALIRDWRAGNMPGIEIETTARS